MEIFRFWCTCARENLHLKLYLSIMNMRDESIFMAHITGIYSTNKCPYHSIILNNKSCGIFVRLHFHFGLWKLWGAPNETMDIMAIYKQNSWILRSQWNDTEWYSLQAWDSLLLLLLLLFVEDPQIRAKFSIAYYFESSFVRPLVQNMWLF